MAVAASSRCTRPTEPDLACRAGARPKPARAGSGIPAVHTPGGGHLPLPGRTPPAGRALSSATTEARPAQIQPRTGPIRASTTPPPHRTILGHRRPAIAAATADHRRRRRRRHQLKPSAAASDRPTGTSFSFASQREPNASPPPSLETAGFPAGLLRRRRGGGRWGREVEGPRVRVATRVAPAGATRGQAEAFF
jgi:hypothetical protein